MESPNKISHRRQEKNYDESPLICKDFKRKELSDILNSSEEMMSPSPLKNLVSTPLPSKTLTKLNISCSPTYTSDDSDKEFETLLNEITFFKKEKLHSGSVNATFNCNNDRKSIRNILPAKSWTVGRNIRSMRISSSPKHHITPIVFDLANSAEKCKVHKDAKPNKESPFENGSLHICEKSKSKIAENSSKRFDEKYSFLESLSSKVPLQFAHADAIVYRKNFKKYKDRLVKCLFEHYNARIFNDKLPETMSITWNSRMVKTAGRCTYKRSAKTRVAEIELSTKILDCAERVRDTLVHELCHAACWIIHGYQDGHGATWKYWANRVNQFFPELPLVSRCHNYDIATKYIYKCRGCGGCIGRHSKSLDIKRKVCGHCGATFQLLVNGTSRSGTSISKPLSGFALYVKENYGPVKKTCREVKHAEIMKILSLQFSALQVSNK